jgi:hypothetical protein
MRHNTLKAVFCLAAILGADVSAQAQVTPRQPPPTALKPQAIDDLKSALQQTATIVEGLVTDIRYEFTEADGPWTKVTLSNVRALLGSAPSVVQIRQFGGQLPNGRMMVVAELPVFVKSKRHIVFLRNTAWNLSPVVGDYAFRVETVNNAELLVNSDGLAVTGLGPDGVETGPALFSSPPLDGSPPQSLTATRLSDPGQATAKASPAPPATIGGSAGRPAPTAVEDSSAQSLVGKALTPRDLVSKLSTALSAENLSISGTFYELPAGEFKWRSLRTAGVPGQGSPSSATDSGRPEIDTSRPVR